MCEPDRRPVRPWAYRFGDGPYFWASRFGDEPVLLSVNDVNFDTVMRAEKMLIMIMMMMMM